MGDQQRFFGNKSAKDGVESRSSMYAANGCRCQIKYMVGERAYKKFQNICQKFVCADDSSE